MDDALLSIQVRSEVGFYSHLPTAYYFIVPINKSKVEVIVELLTISQDVMITELE